MRHKVKWRAEGEEPLSPELFESDMPAKARAFELLAKYGTRIVIDVWNKDKTWQIIAPPGVADWCKKD
jgi:hypothetical protein